MQQADAIALIEKGIDPSYPQRWADLGAGSGTFTLALQKVLHQDSEIIAVDKQAQRLPVQFIRADFVKDELPLSNLDGILMANALHYVQDKQALIRKLENHFRAEGRFLIVEYDTRRSNPWVPYPIRFDELQALFQPFGYDTEKLAEYPSRFGGRMYAALATARLK